MAKFKATKQFNLEGGEGYLTDTDKMQAVTHKRNQTKRNTSKRAHFTHGVSFTFHVAPPEAHPPGDNTVLVNERPKKTEVEEEECESNGRALPFNLKPTAATGEKGGRGGYASGAA